MLRAIPASFALAFAQPALDLTSAARPPLGGNANGCPHVDSAALERFVDKHLGEGLEERLFPGAAFVFVQDGRVVLPKGYGLANVGTRRPVDPNTTRFFGGSLAKLVTATAIVQLADRGVVDLDADVNLYLKRVRVDSNFAEPVTLRHLLTHTAGFDRRDIGLGARTPEEVLTLEEYLLRDLTPRVEPPGSAFRYSNLGLALAGLVVEDVTGIPFATYVQDSIFVPIGMVNSTMYVPEEDPNLTPSYVPIARRTGWREARTIYSHNAPAIGLRTTAADMARFAMAHLNGGELDGHRILSEQATAEMQQIQFAPDPRLDGSGLGFRVSRRMGLRIVGHRGLVNQHASSIDLIPSANAAFFVVCNASDCARIEPMIDELMDRFVCGERPDSITVSLVAGVVPARELAGTYRPKRQAKRSIEKARALFDEMELWARGDTLMVAAGLRSREVDKMLPVAPDEYEVVDGGGRLVLLPGSNGPRLFFAGLGFPQEELLNLSYVQTRSFFMHMSLASTAGLASAIVLLPVTLAARRWRRSPDGRGTGLWAATMGTLLAALLLAFLLGMQRVLGGAVETEFLFGMPTSVKALLWLPVAAIIVWIPLPMVVVRLWRDRIWTAVERLYFTCLLLGCLALFALLYYWNMIGTPI